MLGCNWLPSPAQKEGNQRIGEQLSPVTRPMCLPPPARPIPETLRWTAAGRNRAGTPPLGCCQRATEEAAAAGIARGFTFALQPQQDAGQPMKKRTGDDHGNTEDGMLCCGERERTVGKKKSATVPLWQDAPCTASPGINPAPCFNAERLTAVPRRPICTKKGAIWRQAQCRLGVRRV